MSEVKIKVKIGRRPFFWLTANNPTILGLILQSKTPKDKYEIVEGLELAWVQQVIENVKQGYPYNTVA